MVEESLGGASVKSVVAISSVGAATISEPHQQGSCSMAKKRTKKGQVSIPRDVYVYGCTDGKVESLTLEMDPVSRQLNILEIDPGSIRRQVTYVRQNKDDKVLYSAPADDFSMSLDLTAELKSRFDYLMAVDTNTLVEIHQGYRVSACCIYVVKDHLSSLSADTQYGHHATFLILNEDLKAKSEPIGWFLAITQSIPLQIRGERVGVIVDSELGRHLDINSGKEPYYDTNYLPSNMKLLYASSDASATFANDMIRLCDLGAKAVLNEFKKKGVSDLLTHETLKVGTALCYRVVSSK